MSTERSTVITRQVHGLLESARAFRELPADVRHAIASHTVTVAMGLVDEERALAGEVDFPAFVKALIQGTFHAIVDASAEQMHAYADLVRAVAEAIAASDADDRDPPHRHQKVAVAHALRMGIHRIVVTDGSIQG